MKKMNNIIRKIYRYFERTYKNKIVAIAILLIGFLPAIVSNDLTFMIFMSIFAVPLFFAKENEIR